MHAIPCYSHHVLLAPFFLFPTKTLSFVKADKVLLFEIKGLGLLGSLEVLPWFEHPVIFPQLNASGFITELNTVE